MGRIRAIGEAHDRGALGPQAEILQRIGQLSQRVPERVRPLAFQEAQPRGQVPQLAVVAVDHRARAAVFQQ